MIELDDRAQAATIDQRTRLLWLGIREGLLCMIRAIEAYLMLERSRPTKREREE